MEQTKEMYLVRLTPEEKSKKKDLIAREVPLTILLNGKELVTLLCTPHKLEYLAIGFLLSEGLLKKGVGIKRISLNEKGWYIHIDLEDSFHVDKELSSQRVIGSGCAGAVTFYRSIDAQGCVPLDSKIQIPREEIFF